MQAQGTATGHLTIDDRRTGRVWVASLRFGDGQRTRRVLGHAWVKPHGTTARGATKWRRADGPKPNPDYLTPKEAGRRLAELLRSLPDRTAPEGRYRRRTVTLADAVTEWLRHRAEEKGAKPSTLRSYENDAKRYLLANLGASAPVATITTRDVERLKTKLHAQGLSARTVQKAMVELHGVLERAKRMGWIDRNPATDAERVSTKRKGDIRVLEPEQVFAVARVADDAHPGTWMGSLFVFAAFSGLRLGECRALRWEDVDFANEAVRVRRSQAQSFAETSPKSGKVRSVPLIEQSARVLARLADRGYYDAPTDRVFPSPTGYAFDDNAVRAALYDALDAVGLGHLRTGETPFRFHDLRHTFGTLAARVFAIRDVQAYMGHANIATTEIYLHHSPQTDAAAKLGALIGDAIDPLAAATGARA